MQTTQAFVLAAVLGLARAELFDLEYYGARDCAASGAVHGVKLEQAHVCYDLESDALAFHVGGPGTTAQIPQGCKINGYSDAGCKGGLNIELQGPTSETQCYVVGTNMGQHNPVRSIVFFC